MLGGGGMDWSETEASFLVYSLRVGRNQHFNQIIF